MKELLQSVIVSLLFFQLIDCYNIKTINYRRGISFKLYFSDSNNDDDDRRPQFIESSDKPFVSVQSLNDINDGKKKNTNNNFENKNNLKPFVVDKQVSIILLIVIDYPIHYSRKI